mgnify:CR=1 FL=1
MTEAEREEFDKLKKEVAALRQALKSLLQFNERQARSNARRRRNLLDRDEKFAQMCEDLAASVI